MRIAQLANFVGPRSGGMKTALDALGRGYVTAGVERQLIVPGPEDARHRTAWGELVQVRAPRVGGGYRLIVEPWRVVDALAGFAPTSVELNDKFTLLPVARWARRQGVPTVLFSHERLDDQLTLRTGLEPGSRVGQVSIGLLNRILTRSVDAVVVTSDYARREFAAVAAAAACPVHQIALGVDLGLFHPAPGGSVDGPLRLIHVGRLSREKSPELAVATAVALHRRGHDIRLDVYGEGPLHPELTALAGDAPIHFHGHLDDRRALAARLAEADVALSVCPGETFGLAVLEALACGTPVVTADCGGGRELVDARSGSWAAPHPDALADAVLEVASRPIGPRRQAARRRAERFPWTRTVAEMLALHGDLVDGRAVVTA